VLRPENEASIVDLIQRARASGRRIRVHGARHSVAPSIGTGVSNGLELRLDRLSKIAFDGPRVTVGGGVRLGEDKLARAPHSSSLLFALGRRGLALPNLGGVSSQTLAGFVSTGSAGGSFEHRLTDRVKRIRFVDGRAEVHDVRPGDREFGLIGTSMGLLGVITEIELEAEPQFNLVGEEQVVLREDAPFDLRANDARSVFTFLERHAYARVLWWPQPGAQRFVLWSARRATATDRNVFEPNPYRALPTIGGSDRPMQLLASLALRTIDTYPDPRWAKLLIDGFLPPSRRAFWDRWDRALPMDDGVDERLLPVDFAELWFSRENAAEALVRLDDYFERHALKGTSNFAVELYAGAESPFLMSPGFEQPALRINVFHVATNQVAPASRFAAIWDLFEDMAPRLHWGKHLPPPPRAAEWIARAWPHRDELLAAREALDPDSVFLNDYYRERLGIPERTRRLTEPEMPRRNDLASKVFSWPMAFELEPVGLDFIPQAKRKLVYTVDCFADPTFLFDAFAHMDEGREWMEQFVSMEADRRGPGAVFDETFTFMRFRARTLVFDRPGRWVARLEAASLPLATRMIEEVEIVRQPNGRANVCWTFSFDPHPLALPMESVLTRVFDGLFSRSLRRLGRFAESRAGIRREWSEARS